MHGTQHSMLSAIKASFGRKATTRPQDTLSSRGATRVLTPRPDASAASRLLRLPELGGMVRPLTDGPVDQGETLPALAGAGPAVEFVGLGRSPVGTTAASAELEISTMPVLAVAGPEVECAGLGRSPVGTTAAPAESEFSTLPATVTDPVVPSGSMSAAPKISVSTMQYAGRMLHESIVRMDSYGAVPITTDQLQNIGIRNLGLGEADTSRIKFVSYTIEVYGGQVVAGTPQITGLHNKDVYPSHIIDTAVLISKNTPQAEKFISVGLNAFNEVRSEAKLKFKFAADFVLKLAVKAHALRAYAGYVKILSRTNEIDKITIKRAIAMKEWVHTLRLDIEDASEAAKLIEEARTKQFIAELAFNRLAAAKKIADRNDDSDDAL